MKKLQGELTISGSMQGGDMEDKVSITLIDESSGCELIEIVVSKLDFLNSLCGRSHVKCSYNLQEDCPVGKKREVKREAVFVPFAGRNNSEASAVIRAAVSAHEQDGWRGRDEDAQNMHRYIAGREPPPGENGRWFHVTFIRYVEQPCEEKSPSS